MTKSQIVIGHIASGNILNLTDTDIFHQKMSRGKRKVEKRKEI